MQTGKDLVHKGCNQVFFLKKGYQQVESAGSKEVEAPSINTLQQSFIQRMPVLCVKERISFCKPPFGVESGAGLRGNVCDSSLAGWKARSQLSIGYN